jgi:DNA-binding beta-propeller fold protein YncE/4-amino-4-deoxy-L-arabinose transferase-like glycosyltransferase
MAELTESYRDDGVLDRSIDLSRVSGWGIVVAITLVATAATRLIGLDWVALSQEEGRRAFQALSLYDGRPLGPGVSLPDTSPLFLLGQAISFFLFGVTDVTARLAPALAGFGLVALAFALKPFVGRRASLGMGILAALSPTIAYSARTAQPETLVAFFGFLSVVALLYAGKAAAEHRRATAWTVILGFALAALLASGPSSLTVLIGVIVGLVVARLSEQGGLGPVDRGVRALVGSSRDLIALASAFGLTLIGLFSRGFSSLESLGGIPDTFADWVRLLSTESSATPTQHFLLAVLLYEALAIFGAIAGAASSTPHRPDRLSMTFFAGWFLTQLVLFSFSAGRLPEHTIHVALPVVLMGGAGLAAVVSRLAWDGVVWRRTLLLIALAVAWIGVIGAFMASAARIDDQDTGTDLFETFAVLIIGVVPLTVATFYLLNERGRGSTRGMARLTVLVLTVAVLLYAGAYTVRANAMLNYYRADTSLELLAQRTSTPAVPAFVRQIRNLSRDLTVRSTSTQDPTGGHGISIAIESNVQWPYRWYFREFPNIEVVEPGFGATIGADLVIAREETEMSASGFVTRSLPVRNRVPPEYVTPSFGGVLSYLLPTRWGEGLDFLIFREGVTRPDPEPVGVGYGSRLANQLFPSSGPYSILERVGTGAGRGQFNEPRDVAVDLGQGTIYVVDSANGRVQRFEPNGAFIGIWGGADSPVQFTVTPEGLGPTGIAVGFDGLVHVADTWGHRIIVLSPDGQVVREFGAFGDTLDDPTAEPMPGMFFGPRDVAVTATEIFVVDTGNERVQVFAPDGTFIRSWGGYGSEPAQFIEPVGIAIGPDSRVFVADSGNHRISVFARDGTPLEQWDVVAWQGHFFYEPYLAFDQFGRLYATSSATGTIELFDLSGEYLDSIAAAGNESLDAPIGIALGLDGMMVVTDRGISAALMLPVSPFAQVEDDFDVAATPEATPLVGGTPVAVDGTVPVASPEASPMASPTESTPEE